MMIEINLTVARPILQLERYSLEKYSRCGISFFNVSMEPDTFN